MVAPSKWGEGLWDEARWSYVSIEGDITDGSDITLGGIAIINPIGGLIYENPDQVAGAITTINHLEGAVVESHDITDGEILASQAVSGDITENQDAVTGLVSTVNPITGDITENADVVMGGINNLVMLAGNITENEDEAYGTVSLIYPLFGNITEGKDIVDGQINSIIYLSGAIKENKDIVRGNIFGPKGVQRGGGWAPQFYYEREWEKKPEVVIEIEEIYEPDPEALFIPTALPIDPAVARMIESMMRGPAPVDTDDDDMEALLMHL